MCVYKSWREKNALGLLSAVVWFVVSHEFSISDEIMK